VSDRILLTNLLDTEMDRVQKYMKEWGGADWSLRQHSDLRVSQVWFIKVDGLSDGELTDHIYKLCGYDHLTGRKAELHMNVDISSAPPSEWRIARVDIRRL